MGASRSIDLATVTPSLLIRAGPKLFLIRTVHVFGPSVDLTASDDVSTPCGRRSRAVRAEAHLRERHTQAPFRSWSGGGRAAGGALCHYFVSTLIFFSF